MDNFSFLARKAARGFAPLAAGLAAFGVASGAVRPVAADPSGTVQLASTSAINNSVWRPFGTVNGAVPADALAKDARGNYTNPDAITAHTALTLYVAGALRYAIHPPNDVDPTEWDYQNRFVGIDNPGKLTAQLRIDDHGNLVSDGGRLTSLVQMFNDSNDHDKAIILATVRMSHDQVTRAMMWNVTQYNNPSVGLQDASLSYVQSRTTDAKLIFITNRIAVAGLDPDQGAGQGPAPAGQSVMDYVQATTNITLTDARLAGGIMPFYKNVLKGPQPQDHIATRMLIASLIGVPYPPGAQVANAYVL